MLLILEERRGEGKEGKGEFSSHPLEIIQRPVMARAGLGQSWDLETQSRSPEWVALAQILSHHLLPP